MQEDTIKDIINDARKLAIGPQPLTRLALESIADRLQALCDAGLKIAPKAAVDAAKDATTANLPLPGDEKKKRGLVGEISNSRAILAWCYADDLDIRVVGSKYSEDVWGVSAWRGGRIVFDGESYGGKGLAVMIAKYLRNGLVSRALRGKGKGAKRAAEAAAEKAAEDRPTNRELAVQFGIATLARGAAE